jgi:hypothetical protein
LVAKKQTVVFILGKTAAEVKGFSFGSSETTKNERNKIISYL